MGRPNRRFVEVEDSSPEASEREPGTDVDPGSSFGKASQTSNSTASYGDIVCGSRSCIDKDIPDLDRFSFV